MWTLIIFFTSLFLFNQPIQAITSNTDTINSNKVEDITDKLKEIVKGVSTEKNSTDNKPKSFFGNITQVTNDSIIISSDNQNKTLQLNEDITCINSKRQKVKANEFKEGDTILAMGYLNQDNSLDCRRIVATDSESIENNNQIITGQIVDVSQSQTSIFTFTPFQNKETSYQITFDSKTSINNTNNDELKSSEIITKGQKIIIVMHPNEENSQTFYATKIISLETTSPTPTK